MAASEGMSPVRLSYDAADRLIEERLSAPVLGHRTISYTYDPVGNRLTKDDNGVMTAYSYDDNDRLLTETGYAYTYDKNGNMLTKTGNGEEWQLTYNALNHVEHVDISTSQGTSSLAYTYDHDGIRIGKTINGTEVVQYVVDKNRPYAQVLEEQHTRGGTHPIPSQEGSISYVYGDALISADTEGSTHYYHTDGLGSVRGLSDASGALTDSYTYDAYGLLTTSRGATVNPYLYRGEQYDADLDAYYLRARYYQPEIGRFVSADPVEGFPTEPMSWHRYVYGNNDPVNKIDPSGQSSLSEQLTTTAIVGVLNAAAIAGSYTEAGKTAYAWLGEHFFPDAMVLGAIGSADAISAIASFLNVPLPISTFYNVNFAGTASGGIEILMSISSGQVATFLVGGAMAEFNNVDFIGHGYRPRPLVNVSLYRGYVWNLWNAGDYAGWFMNTGVGTETHGSWGLFWDLKRWFGGPWGVSRTIWSKNVSLKKDIAYRSFQLGFTAYHEPLPFELDFANEYSVLPFVMLTIGIDHFINATRSAGNLQLPTKQLALLLGETTFWAQLTWAKVHWNKKSEYSVSKRQNSERPTWFHSGPHFPYF